MIIWTGLLAINPQNDVGTRSIASIISFSVLESEVQILCPGTRHRCFCGVIFQSCKHSGAYTQGIHLTLFQQSSC